MIFLLAPASVTLVNYTTVPGLIGVLFMHQHAGRISLWNSEINGSINQPSVTWYPSTVDTRGSRGDAAVEKGNTVAPGGVVQFPPKGFKQIFLPRLFPYVVSHVWADEHHYLSNLNWQFEGVNFRKELYTFKKRYIHIWAYQILMLASYIV